MNKIRIVVACKSLKIQDAIRDLSVNDKFEILDFIEDETNVIETIKYTKPDLVFLEDDFENLKVINVLEQVNKSYCEAITAFVVISNKKIPLQMGIYHKYNVLNILYTPLDDEDIKTILWESESKISSYFENVKKLKEQGIEDRLYNYRYNRHIDYSKYFTEDDCILLEKLDVYIDFTQKYTEEENEIFAMNLNKYWDGAEDTEGNRLPPTRKLEITGVSRDDFNRIYETINNVETLYT